MFKKLLSLPDHCIRACVKEKRIDRGDGYGLEIPAKYIFYVFYGNEKAVGKENIRCCRWECEKVLSCLK